MEEVFMTQESVNAVNISDFFDKMSFLVKKKTFIVLDNASVLRNAKFKEMRSIWVSRDLFLSYLPPYSPELNLAPKSSKRKYHHDGKMNIANY